MKTGIQLIAEKRKRQLGEHGRTIQKDVEENNSGQLRIAIRTIIAVKETHRSMYCPEGWEQYHWEEMCGKTYEERLALAGAWCAAEIDRINNDK